MCRGGGGGPSQSPPLDKSAEEGGSQVPLRLRALPFQKSPFSLAVRSLHPYLPLNLSDRGVGAAEVHFSSPVKVFICFVLPEDEGEYHVVAEESGI